MYKIEMTADGRWRLCKTSGEYLTSDDVNKDKKLLEIIGETLLANGPDSIVIPKEDEFGLYWPSQRAAMYIKVITEYELAIADKC